MYNIEDYKWNLNPRFIKIMSVDNTHIHYLSEKEKEMRSARSLNDNNFEAAGSLGIPVIGLNNNNNK